MYRIALITMLFLVLSVSSYCQKIKRNKINDPLLATFRLIPAASSPEFYMNETEVSNGEYLETLSKIAASGDSVLYHQLLPDTNVWRNNFGDPYIDHYLRYPGFKDFPVVGITYKQAERYCEWLTHWYNQQPKRKIKRIVIELPNEAQWEMAARAGRADAIYPWGTPYTQDATGKWLANFTRVDQGNIVWDTLCNQRLLVGLPSDKLPNEALITTPVQTYGSNDYGVYNMAGNVEEIVRYHGTEGLGLAKGGSYADPGHFLKISSRAFYQIEEASHKRGFRLSMRILEE